MPKVNYKPFKLKIHKVVNNFVDCGVRGIDKPGTTKRVSTVGDSLAHIQEVILTQNLPHVSFLVIVVALDGEYYKRHIKWNRKSL